MHDCTGKNILNNFKKILGQYCAINQFIELSKRCFVLDHEEDMKNRENFIDLATYHKAIDISLISDDYKFLGGKKECARYMKKMIACRPKERYVNRTRMVKRNINEMRNMICLPGYEHIEY